MVLLPRTPRMWQSASLALTYHLVCSPHLLPLPDLNVAPPPEQFSQSAFHSLPHYSMPGAYRDDLLLPSTQANLHRSCTVMKV